MITLYDSATAPSPRHARIPALRKGVACHTVEVDLRNGEQLSDAYRKVNPQCTVSAAAHGRGPAADRQRGDYRPPGARFLEPPLLGCEAQVKAEIVSWNWRVEFEVLLAVAEALRNSAPATANRALSGPVDYPQIPELAQRGLARCSISS